MFRSGFLSVMSLGVVAVLLVAAAAGLTTWWVDGPEDQELTGVTVDLLELDESGHSGWAALIKEGRGGEDTESQARPGSRRGGVDSGPHPPGDM